MSILTLEAVKDGAVRGWAYDPDRPTRRPTVQLLLGGVPVAERRADVFREDLKDALIGDGRYGFTLQAPLEILQSDADVSVIVVNGGSVGGPAVENLNAQIRGTLQRLLWSSIVAEVGVHKSGIAVDLAITMPRGLAGQLRAKIDDILIWSCPANGTRTDDGIGPIFVPGHLRTGGSLKFELEIQAYGEQHLLLQEDLQLHQYQQSIVGWMDGVFSGKLRGWAWDAGDPCKAVTVAIFVDDRFVGRTTAALHRPDLEQQEIREGLAGFELQLPAHLWDDRPHTARVQIGDNAPIFLPPQAFTIAKERGTDPRVYLDQAKLPNPRYAEASAEVGQLALTVKVGTHLTTSTDAFYLKRQQRSRQAISIIIPVFNAPEHLRRCLAAVRRNTTFPYRIVLIDDASNAEGMAAIFSNAEASGDLVLRNSENLGFTKSVNLGIESSVGDVVLLNSDTEVGPRWLEKLVWTAYSNPSVGTVSAVSQNAGAFSVPTIYDTNDLVRGLTTDDNAVLLGRSLASGRMNVPTGHGFCLFIRRAVLNEIGALDPISFPRGYGEENDFCMRALKAGYQNVVQPRVVVGHAKGASFLSERDKLMSDGQLVLRSLHPEYLAMTNIFRGPSMLAEARSAAALVTEWAGKERNAHTALEATKPRVLIALHYAAEGGTALTTEDLVSGLQQDFTCFLLTTEGAAVVLSEWRAGWKELVRWDLRSKIDYLDAPRPDYEVIVTNLLVDFDISLVHVRHLIGHHDVLMQSASDLHIPVIWSLHDFYQICPSVSLVDAEGRYCGGRCTRGEADCSAVVKLPMEYGRLRNGHIATWQTRTARLSQYVDSVVTTSESIREVMRANVPALGDDSKFHVIEHGRDRLINSAAARRPRPSEPIRVLMLGNLLPSYKGFKVAQAVKDLDVRGDVEFHFLGAAPASARQVGYVHGRYDRSDIVEKIAAIAPSVVGIWSTWPETYCHTLSEAWLAGVPVIGSRLGAVGERLLKHGGGWVTNCETPAEIFSLLIRLRQNPDEWDLQRAKASSRNLRSAAEMSSDYRILYKSLIRSLGFGGSTEPIVQAVVHRSDSDHAWGDAQTRLSSVLKHSAVTKLVDTLYTSAAEVAAFGKPSLSVPGYQIAIDEADESGSSGARSGSIVNPSGQPPFINELPWRAAAFLAGETDYGATAPKIVAVLAEKSSLSEKKVKRGLDSLAADNFLVRIISPSELPRSISPLEFASNLRQSLLGASLVIPIASSGLNISSELNLIELGLLGVPILWHPTAKSRLELPKDLAWFSLPGNWAASAHEMLSDTDLVAKAEALSVGLAERWGMIPRLQEFVEQMHRVSG